MVSEEDRSAHGGAGWVERHPDPAADAAPDVTRQPQRNRQRKQQAQQHAYRHARDGQRADAKYDTGNWVIADNAVHEHRRRVARIPPPPWRQRCSHFYVITYRLCKGVTTAWERKTSGIAC